VLGKLTWIHFGLVFLAGWAGSGCSQEPREPVEVGTTQVELRSDPIRSETPDASTILPIEEHLDYPNQSANPVPDIQRMALPGLDNDSRDRAYRGIKRYEFLPDLLKQPKTRNKSAQESVAQASLWTLSEKYWVRAGKGFGVAAAGRVSSKTVHIDDASYYLPTAALNPYSKASEHLMPMDEPFKSHKSLVFHSGATGFAYEPPEDATLSSGSPAVDTQLELAPIPETQVYLSAKPKAHVILAPAKNRLDLMNGNENLNRSRFRKLPR